MGKEILTFDDIEIGKKIYRNKSPIFWEDADVEKVLVSSKISSPEKNYKYFFGYLKNDHKVKSLNIMLPITIVYLKSYDRQTKTMYFLIKNNDLLDKYNTIWDKVSADIKKQFAS